MTSHEMTTDSILYELLVYSEWKQEPELPKISNQSKQGLTALLQLFRSRDSHVDSIGRVLSWQQAWRLAAGDGGKVVAIIQDLSLEIRTSRDEYSSVVGKAALPKDPFPQWRRWCWSPDCSILAVGFSNGCVRAYDLMGSNLFTLFPPNYQEQKPVVDTSSALASLFFIQARVKTHKWSSELVAVDYSGELRSYLVSPTEGFQESHTFSLNRHYRQGVTAVAYHPAHSVLFVAGVTGRKNNAVSQEQGSGIGVTAWRILNDHPFYQLVLPDKQYRTLLPDSFWNRLPSLRNRSLQSVVVRMEVSPSGASLAALHSCGGISIWHLPGIRKVGFWPLLDQPGWDTQNPFTVQPQSPSPSSIQPPVSSTVTSASSVIEDYYPIDLDWWSNEAIVVSRRCGAVSVCNVEGLQNMLGESPEFLAGAAQVRRLHNEKGFIALECDVEPVGKNRGGDLDLEDEFLEENEDDDSKNEDEVDEASATLLSRLTMVISSVVYMVTDMERFQPRRKRLRLFRRTYRLLALRSTTPEELYTRKLDNGEYGEALTLAHAYNLDSDLVHQRQWRNSSVSVATIRDYLSKISKQTWVLRECVERVPESLSAARELVCFGLKATNKDALRSVGNKRKVRDVDDLTEEQRELLVFRRTLLQYQDRLTTYEIILGGPQLADELFEHTFYAEFRSSSSLRACVQFARSSNWQAVDCMLKYHGAQTLQHWLPILSNFPETVCPTDYRSLLPECCPDGFVFPREESSLRELDWSEKEPYSLISGVQLDSPEEDSECLYKDEPGLSAFRVKELTPELVTRWYHDRIRAIERGSRMVDNALILLRLARDRNVEGLEYLYQELQTLDALVYELLLEDISLADLEKNSPLEKCKLLMSKTTESTFISDLHQFLFPFLNRMEKTSPGIKHNLLRDYLIGVAAGDLSLPLKFFEEIHEQRISEEIPTEEVMSLAISCLYAYLDTDQLPLAQRILACVPVHRVSQELAGLAEQLDVLEMELSASLILQRNLTPKSLGYIRDNKQDPHTSTQLLTRMARSVASSVSSLSEAGWQNLLKDILNLQHCIFSCVPLQKCYEIYSSTLLTSGNVETIRLAKNTLICDTRPQSDHPVGKVQREESRGLVLAAAREYMDSAGSLTDPAMELAKACLHLVEYEDEEIQEELNLVSSFQLLHDFGIRMLPIQVRLCPDRLRLIEQCLKKKPGAHRNSHRLLQLAAYLNINGSDSRQRQGRVLGLVAETAYSVNDFKCCAEVCKQLVAAEYGPAWHIVSQLGRCTQFDDILLRAQFLAFALQHCPSDMLSELVNVRCSLEVESLHQFLNKQVAMHGISLTGSSDLDDDCAEDFVEASSQPEPHPGTDFITSLQAGEATVRQTTQWMLNRVGDTEFWRKAFQIGWDNNSRSEDFESAPPPPPLSRQSCHAFYESLYHSTPCSLSILGPSYNSLVAPDVPLRLQLEQALLRASVLEQVIGSEPQNITNVVVECALSLLPEDNCLALAHLLSLPEDMVKEASEKVFNTNITVIGLQLAQYCAALLGYRKIVGNDKNKLHDVFLYDPSQVIAGILEAGESAEPWSSMVREWTARLEDCMEGQELLTLGCGVNVDRFSCDAQYRQDSILGLAMSEEYERLRLALTLAAKHGVQREQVIAEHIASLMLSDLSCEEIRERLTSGPLPALMDEAAEDVRIKLETTVLGALDGRQHEILKLFYDVMNKLAPEHRFERLLPRDHLKLLTRVESISADIDYRLLIAGPKNTLKAVESSLNSNNIPLLAKLLRALPAALANHLTTAELYSVLIRKKLFQSVEGSPLETIKAVSPLLTKMSPKEMVHLVETVCFPNGEQKTLPSDVAEHLLELAVMSCDRAAEAETESASAEEWTCSAQQLAKWRDHFRASRNLLRSWPCDPCCRLFLESRGDCVAITTALNEAVMTPGVSLDMILQVIKASPASCDLSLESLVTVSLKSALESRRTEDGEWNETIGTILTRLEEVTNTVGVRDPSWVSLLHPLAADDAFPPELRLRVLNLLQLWSADETSGSSLLLPHSRAIIASAWSSGVTVGLQDVSEEGKRMDLLIQLLNITSTWEQRNAVRQLLDLWPPFSSNLDRDLNKEVIYKLLLNCLCCESGAWSDCKAGFVADICRQYILELPMIKDLVDEAQEYSKNETSDNDEETGIDVQLLMLVCLLSENSEAHQMAVSLAQQNLMEPLQDRVAELAASRQLEVPLLTTPAYTGLLSRMLVTEPERTPTLIQALRSRSYFAEAGSVILQSVQRVPRFMRTFSAAVTVGLGSTGEEISQKAISREQSDVHERPSTSKKQHGSKSSSRCDAFVDNWDAPDAEWSSVDDVEATSEALVSNQQETDDKMGESTHSSKTEPEDSGWDDDDKSDWGDWPDELSRVVEVSAEEDVRAHETSPSSHDSSTHSEQSSSPKVTIGSPQSAFVSVPQRGHRTRDEQDDNILVPVQETCVSASVANTDLVPNSSPEHVPSSSKTVSGNENPEPKAVPSDWDVDWEEEW